MWFSLSLYRSEIMMKELVNQIFTTDKWRTAKHMILTVLRNL